MTAHTGVLVVGGGITGLVAARYLVEQIGGEAVTLIEREQRLGGKIVTERTAGFVLEGGPDSFLAAKPGGVELCRSLDLEARLSGTDPDRRGSFIKRRGKLHPLPQGLTGLVPTRVQPLLSTRILSLRGRLRAALEWFVPRRRDGGDETIQEFATRRFGAEAYHWLVEPLLSGIYAGDGGRLSLAATFAQLAEMERTQGSLLRVMMRKRFAARSSDEGFLTPAGGLGEIVEALERQLPDGCIRRGAGAAALRRTRDGYRVELRDGTTLNADAVILATPAFVTADLIRELDAELAEVLREIPFVSVATLSVAYPASAVPRPLDGYGYLCPRAEGGPIVACTWTSSKFPGRAPRDMVLIRLFIGRAGFEEVVTGTDEQLLDVGRNELRQVLGVAVAPTLWRVFRWPNGMPQYTPGHLKRLRRIERRLADCPGLLVAGASYHGVGIPDCIQSGRAAAREAARFKLL